MKISWGKILALVVALGYIFAIIGAGEANLVAAKAGLALLLPLSLIWFPEELGSFTGYMGRGGNIQTETPPILIKIIGWLILLAPIALDRIPKIIAD